MAEISRTINQALNAAGPPAFEGYEIIRRIGLGAASVIYLAKKDQTEEFFALKHVMRHDDEDKRMIEQVENEFEVGRRISHPYIRNFYEIRKRKKGLVRVNEILMLMEYCPGVSLEVSPTRSLLDLLLIFRMVSEGLNGMHTQGYVHCDIKPNNIIIAENGAIRLIDLGQSCRFGTVKRRIQGTPDYIAPEQVKRKPMTRATDVFNLGATLYWALTGKYVPTLLPKQNGAIEVIEPTGPPVSPHEMKPQIPVGLSNLVMECVNEMPTDRPQDMTEVISRFDLLIHMVAGGKPMVGVGNDEEQDFGTA
jgi:serine/threonine-protein kinase